MDPFDSNNELCKVPQRPVLVPAAPGPSHFPSHFPLLSPRKTTRSVAVRIPMLSDETEIVCPPGSLDPAHRVVARSTLKPPDQCDVWQHYKQTFDSKIPRDDEDAWGIVRRTYFAAMCDFEVRWEPRNLVGDWGGTPDNVSGDVNYYDNAVDHQGNRRSRYGQTHVHIFPGHFKQGLRSVLWPGIQGLSVPPGVWDLYITVPVGAWVTGATDAQVLAALTAQVGTAILPPVEIDDEEYPCTEKSLRDRLFSEDDDPSDFFEDRKAGEMALLYYKVATVGDSVIPRANRLELPRGILQLHPGGGGGIDLSLAATRNANIQIQVELPMLSDEVVSGDCVDRSQLKDRNTCSVHEHYKEVRDTKVPADEPNPAGEVSRTYFAAMCDFEVRWDPTAGAYDAGGTDHLGESIFRYGQTHVSVLSGTVMKGAKRATWEGAAAILIPAGRHGVYLKYADDFWSEEDPEFLSFDVVLHAENADCEEASIPEEAGFLFTKLAVAGDGVLPQPTGMHLPRGIQQVSTGSIGFPSLPPANADYKTFLWDETGWSGVAGRWVMDYPRLI